MDKDHGDKAVEIPYSSSVFECGNVRYVNLNGDNVIELQLNKQLAQNIEDITPSQDLKELFDFEFGSDLVQCSLICHHIWTRNVEIYGWMASNCTIQLMKNSCLSIRIFQFQGLGLWTCTLPIGQHMPPFCKNVALN